MALTRSTALRLGIAAAALSAGAMVAIPSAAAAATSPTTTHPTTATTLNVQPATAYFYKSYTTSGECNYAGAYLISIGAYSGYQCRASPSGPFGQTTEWDLWVSID